VSRDRSSVGWAESASPVTSTAYALFEEFHPDSLPRKNCSVNSRGKTRRIPPRLLGLTGEYRRVFSVSFVLRVTSSAAEGFGVANHSEAPMPDDWNDATGWDAHHRSRLARPKRDAWDDETGSIRVEQLPEFVAGLKERGWRSAWVPGCGLSPLAHLLAHLGLEIVATDVSAVAIEFQRGAAARFAHLTANLGDPDPAGSFAAEVHDFRRPYRPEAFDMIVNIKALQAFPSADMAAIAGVHAQALRPGRYAYFDTMNVQGERRDQLEQALQDGGFVVPLLAVNRWYRQALRETGIPHMFVLGTPMIPRTGEYAYGGPKWDADMGRLREVVTEYRGRLAAEQEAEQARIGPTSKVAQVIYSTG
jgi:hypothetical protein